MSRVGLAFRCFFRVLSGKPVPKEALPKVDEVKALPEKAPEESGDDENLARGIQLLGLLQREGRLLDFLQEEIGAYDDAQIGAAIRNIHRDCRTVLGEYLSVSRILEGEEESDVTVDAGFDPSRIRLIGNVTGEPPFSGVLRHHGWRASAAKLPNLPKPSDPTVISPAEVELR